ncbi:uncharacterized protein RCC_09569 [Ramularia collo-cygni]|uniref:Uncharacterized protein n=1 Tax=Ramularia collo-cygni TaxID=112498 RepID=A0A2D3VMA4_9PEZI|nr:uncharacterized protein RCC_09569 [Ramularia collo-cygni]CZT23854.1 uncharacterized protein RCC_09569 [Ramularia collo-cygni]
MQFQSLLLLATAIMTPVTLAYTSFNHDEHFFADKQTQLQSATDGTNWRYCPVKNGCCAQAGTDPLFYPCTSLLSSAGSPCTFSGKTASC